MSFSYAAQARNGVPDAKTQKQVRMQQYLSGYEVASVTNENKDTQDVSEFIIEWNDEAIADAKKELDELALAIDRQKLHPMLPECVKQNRVRRVLQMSIWWAIGPLYSFRNMAEHDMTGKVKLVKREAPYRGYTQKKLRVIPVGMGLPSLDEMRKELDEYMDVLMGRADAPLQGTQALMETADMYYARVSEMIMKIQRGEADGVIPKGQNSRGLELVNSEHSKKSQPVLAPWEVEELRLFNSNTSGPKWDASQYKFMYRMDTYESLTQELREAIDEIPASGFPRIP